MPLFHCLKYSRLSEQPERPRALSCRGQAGQEGQGAAVTSAKARLHRLGGCRYQNHLSALSVPSSGTCTMLNKQTETGQEPGKDPLLKSIAGRPALSWGREQQEFCRRSRGRTRGEQQQTRPMGFPAEIPVDSWGLWGICVFIPGLQEGQQVQGQAGAQPARVNTRAQ